MNCKTIKTLDAATYRYFNDSTKISLTKKTPPNIFDVYGMVFSQLNKLLEQWKCSPELKEKILVQTIYPQIFASIRKIILNDNIKNSEKKKIIDNGIRQEYCRYVLAKEKKYNISNFECLCSKLIIARRYKLLGATLKWVNQRK